MSQAGELADRLKNRGIEMVVTDAALEFAVSQSYDHLYGARPLRRWLEQHIITDLSVKVVGGDLNEGDIVTVGSGGPKGPLTYHIEKGPEDMVNGNDAKRPKWGAALRTASDALDEDDEMEE